MPQHLEKKILPYSAEQLFQIVADVGSYPHFLPWAVNSSVFNQRENQFDAKLIIGYKLIQTSYTSHVYLTPFKRIEIDYLNGPFEYLENYWIFHSLDDHQTEIEFFINFHFKNVFFQKIAERLFVESIRLMTLSFEKRAMQIYPKLTYQADTGHH